VPDLDEFLNPKNQNPNLEFLEGSRPCKSCQEDVDGAFWDPANLSMSWKCSKGHESTFRVQ
jgi:hypothetical protein